MKKNVLVCAVLTIVLASITVVMHVKSSDVMIESNVEALARDEGNDGALYYNEQYSRVCCGPGNVRDCNNPSYVKCNF